MRKAINYIAILVFTMIPVLIARELWFTSPNNHGLLQFIWLTFSFWVLAPFLIIKKDAHLGIEETDANSGIFDFRQGLYLFAAILIIWLVIFLANR